jgi:hypothetical protein
MMFVYKTGCSAGERYSQKLFSKVHLGAQNKKTSKEIVDKNVKCFLTLTPGRSSPGGKTTPVSPQVCRHSGLSAESKFLVPDLGI